MEDGPELGFRKVEGDLKAELVRVHHQIAFLLHSRDLIIDFIARVHNNVDVANA